MNFMRGLGVGVMIGAVAAGWLVVAGGCQLIAGVKDAVLYPPDGGTGSGGQGGGATVTSAGGSGAGGCTDGTINGNETGKDCGGQCKPCTDGDGCKVGPDCDSKVCVGGTCLPPKCTDQIKNGTETGADCGSKLCPSCPNGETCAIGADCQSGICDKNICIIPASCIGLATTCGAGANENCCATPLIPGGTYNRSNDPNSPATVSDYRLDKFEVTVGRFRKFVEAYPMNKPAPGAGKHPLIAESGWNQIWDQDLPADQAAFKANLSACAMLSTWDSMGTNDKKPINCVNWPEAFAFCAWDGARLPTEAEWNYAAAGGSQQLDYPWGSIIDGTYASYNCGGDGSAPGAGNCALSDILNVGSRSPKGDGRWDHADLAGNVWEWTFDAYKNPYMSPCLNCGEVSSYALNHMIRGGSWLYPESNLLSSFRDSTKTLGHPNDVGFRCARNP